MQVTRHILDTLTEHLEPAGLDLCAPFDVSKLSFIFYINELGE